MKERTGMEHSVAACASAAGTRESEENLIGRGRCHSV